MVKDGGVHRSLEDVDRAAMVREVAGRHAWKVPEPLAARLIEGWIDAIADAADDTATGTYVKRRAAALRHARCAATGS